MKITYDSLRQATEQCLVTAGSSYTPDRLAAYGRAIEAEQGANAKWFLQLLKENAEIAQREKLPLCDDTGIPHVIIRLGEHCELPAGWLAAIRAGVSDGLRSPRPSASCPCRATRWRSWC